MRGIGKFMLQPIFQNMRRHEVIAKLTEAEPALRGFRGGGANFLMTQSAAKVSELAGNSGARHRAAPCGDPLGSIRPAGCSAVGALDPANE